MRSTTSCTSLFDQTSWKDEPTMVIGIAMKSTPQTMATDVTSLPPGVAGQRSPYPTVERVTSMNHEHDRMLSNCSAALESARHEARCGGRVGGGERGGAQTRELRAGRAANAHAVQGPLAGSSVGLFAVAARGSGIPWFPPFSR